MATVILRTCNNSIEANLIMGVLENNGIYGFLTNENFTNLMPHFNGMMGAGVQIVIDEDDLEKAQRILLEQSNNNEIVCPNCHCANVKFGLGSNKIRKIFSVFISLLVFIPFGNIRNTYYCLDCKTEFKI